jgi:hypothetical protein
MSGESLPSPDEAICALTAEVTERIRRGEQPATIRAELLAQGLDVAIVDHILLQAAPRRAHDWRTTFSIILSGGIVVVCSLGGFAGGVWLACQIPPGGPGLVVMATCLLAVGVVGVATALGVGVGLGITALLANWTARDDDLDECD